MNATIVYVLKYKRDGVWETFDIFDTKTLAWEQHDKNNEFVEELFEHPCVETWVVQKELR